MIDHRTSINDQINRLSRFTDRVAHIDHGDRIWSGQSDQWYIHFMDISHFPWYLSREMPCSTRFLIYPFFLFLLQIGQLFLLRMCPTHSQPFSFSDRDFRYFNLNFGENYKFLRFHASIIRNQRRCFLSLFFSLFFSRDQNPCIKWSSEFFS